MTNKELLRAIIAEIDFIMHGKDYRFPESENTWYSRESCKVLTPEEVFEELRTELLQLNNETNREIAELKKQLNEWKDGTIICKWADAENKVIELQKQLEEKEKTIQGLIEAQEYLENSASYQMFLDIKNQLEKKEKEIKYYESELKGLQIDLDHYKGECFNLQDRLKSQPAEIVEKIRMKLPNRCYGKKLFKNILKEVLAEYTEQKQ